MTQFQKNQGYVQLVVTVFSEIPVYKSYLSDLFVIEKEAN